MEVGEEDSARQRQPCGHECGRIESGMSGRLAQPWEAAAPAHCFLLGGFRAIAADGKSRATFAYLYCTAILPVLRQSDG
jgi:hypothetical protein